MSKTKLSEGAIWGNVILDALDEMDESPDDSVQEIWNEAFDRWKLPYRMRPNSYIIDRIGE